MYRIPEGPLEPPEAACMHSDSTLAHHACGSGSQLASVVSGTPQLGSTTAITKKKSHCIFSSQIRADQMPGAPRKGQLMCTLFLSMRQETFYKVCQT